MRVNTEKSIELGRQIHEEFGSWQKAREAARLQNGVYVLPPRRDSDSNAKSDKPR